MDYTSIYKITYKDMDSIIIKDVGNLYTEDGLICINVKIKDSEFYTPLYFNIDEVRSVEVVEEENPQSFKQKLGDTGYNQWLD